MDAIAKVAFFRTYACLWVRHARTGSIALISPRPSQLSRSSDHTHAREALQARRRVVLFCIFRQQRQLCQHGGPTRSGAYFLAHIRWVPASRTGWHCFLCVRTCCSQVFPSYTHHTNIHSCRSLPCASCFGHTSRKRYINFLSCFDLEGMINRMMCMRRPACGSPLSMIERIFFWELIRTRPDGMAGQSGGMFVPSSRSSARRTPSPAHS